MDNINGKIEVMQRSFKPGDIVFTDVKLTGRLFGVSDDASQPHESISIPAGRLMLVLEMVDTEMTFMVDGIVLHRIVTSLSRLHECAFYDAENIVQ